MPIYINSTETDEMKIETRLLKGAIERIIEKAIFKKFGFKIDFHLDNLYFKQIDGVSTIDISASVVGNTEDVCKAFLPDIF